MQFLITAHDHPDALPRRMEVRERHIALGDRMKAEGKMLYAAAILDDAGEMRGSMIVCDFPDRAALDDYLAVEPYVTGNVWGNIDVRPCRVGKSFVKQDV